MPSTLSNPEQAVSSGTLYVVATPIGHPDDLTIRAARVLAAVDLIAAEDTRVAGRLLAHHGITNRLVSYQEYNETRRTEEILTHLAQGLAVALITDAGTPLVSDPGYRLIHAVAEAGRTAVPIPGASAAIAAMSVAGLPTDRFSFIGFPAKRAAQRRQQLAALAARTETLVVYESPRRLAAFIDDALDVLGDRQAVVAREMTKPYEEFIRGPLSDIARTLTDRPRVKGECTVIIAGAGEPEPVDDEKIRHALRQQLADSDCRPSEAARTVAAALNIPKRLAYAHAQALADAADDAARQDRPDPTARTCVPADDIE